MTTALNTFQIGDRVCYKKAPSVTGTIEEVSSKGKYGVVWDAPATSGSKTTHFYSKHYLAKKDEQQAKKGNPNFLSRETNPAVIANENHPVFPGLSCCKSATVQIPEKVKEAIAKPDGSGIDESLYRKIQFLIRKHALKSTGCKSWEEFKELKQN